MTDIQKLKSLAEDFGDAEKHWGSRDKAERELAQACTPATVLELIAKIERMMATQKALLVERAAHIRQRDHLKAENESLRQQLAIPSDVLADAEALRRDAERLSRATSFVQGLCDAAGEQPSVATGYLHDILSVMSKEASHD
ncbi:hypothetical protein ACI2KS_10210 [Pseudomonas sp. NPDC087358]|uniref:hypothetical protein n=1 Tax=Pseudomonas sp. NPDC087358 TaxID=3364439 RepID=UPI00384F9ABA